MMLSRWKITRAAFDAAAKLLHAQLVGDGDEGDDGASASEDQGVFYAQLGVAVRPIISRTLRALGAEDGDDVAVLKMWDRARSPVDLAEGETRVYACGNTAVALKMLVDGVQLTARGAIVTITSAGAVQITPASGQDVVLNGGTLRVARETDAVDLGTWTHVPAAGAGVTPCSLTYTPPSGAPTPLGVATPVAGKITAGAGATRVKA